MILPADASPWPCGSPAPFGRTVKSLALISVSVAGRPGVCAKAVAQKIAAAIHLHMRHAPVFMHEPPLDRVAVILAEAPADAHQILERWLHVSGFIRASRFERRRRAVPLPHQPKTRRR